MNSNGSVPCQVLSNVSIIAYPTLVSDRMRSLSPIVIYCADNRDELAGCAELYQSAGLCVEFHHVVYVLRCPNQLHLGFYYSERNRHISGVCGEDLQGFLHS